VTAVAAPFDDTKPSGKRSVRALGGTVNARRPPQRAERSDAHLTGAEQGAMLS